MNFSRSGDGMLTPSLPVWAILFRSLIKVCHPVFAALAVDWYRAIEKLLNGSDSADVIQVEFET